MFPLVIPEPEDVTLVKVPPTTGPARPPVRTAHSALTVEYPVPVPMAGRAGASSIIPELPKSAPDNPLIAGKEVISTVPVPKPIQPGLFVNAPPLPPAVVVPAPPLSI